MDLNLDVEFFFLTCCCKSSRKCLYHILFHTFLQQRVPKNSYMLMQKVPENKFVVELAVPTLAYFHTLYICLFLQLRDARANPTNTLTLIMHFISVFAK